MAATMLKTDDARAESMGSGWKANVKRVIDAAAIMRHEADRVNTRIASAISLRAMAKAVEAGATLTKLSMEFSTPKELGLGEHDGAWEARLYDDAPLLEAPDAAERRALVATLYDAAGRTLMSAESELERYGFDTWNTEPAKD